MKINNSMLSTHFKSVSLKTVHGLFVLCLFAGTLSHVSAGENTPIRPGKVEAPGIPTDKAPFAGAQEDNESGTQIKTYNFPLMDFMLDPKPIVLRKANDQHALYFPVSNRIDVSYEIPAWYLADQLCKEQLDAPDFSQLGALLCSLCP